MNIEQIRAAAEAKSAHLSDCSCIRILVASLTADSRAAALLKAFRDAISESELDLKVIRTGSFGCYDLEPIVVIETPDSPSILYHNVIPDDISLLMGNCGKRNVRMRDKTLCWIGKEKVNGIPHIDELPLFKLQSRMALRNCGWIDPESIAHYIVRGQGYTGLSQALQMGKGALLNVLTESALNGRNEIGGSTVKMWRLCGESEEKEKYLICNAIDMDPKALTAGLLLESDPHSVLEGMLISAFAVGASRCIVFVKENSDSVRRIAEALDQMRAHNLLGTNILDSHFTSEIEVREAPASGTLGYQTELFRCIEEKQALPHIDPIYPAAGEFERKPAVITNPEIMSDLSFLLAGNMEKGRSSKVITLSGSIVHKHTVEVAFETSISSIVDELGGGVSGEKAIKAAKLGGPAGAFITPNLFERSLCGLNGEKLNADFCPGSIEVFDSDARMVDAAKDDISYLQTQSCGRCSFCREGSLQMLAVLEDIAENKGNRQDLALLTELGNEMRTACLCAFGRSLPNPVLSSLELFQSEYDERVAHSPFPVPR